MYNIYIYIITTAAMECKIIARMPHKRNEISLNTALSLFLDPPSAIYHAFVVIDCDYIEID